MEKSSIGSTGVGGSLECAVMVLEVSVLEVRYPTSSSTVRAITDRLENSPVDINPLACFTIRRIQK